VYFSLDCWVALLESRGSGDGTICLLEACLGKRAYKQSMADNIQSSPPPLSSSELNVKPIVVVIVVVLSVVLVCSGMLQFLARCLGGRRYAPGPATALTAAGSNSLRGQLQHLWRLHEGGLDQSFIDALPVFLYGTIRGLKDGADCAVCLSEFSEEDHLRLLPNCKHAFHVDCIDTWLLSNSTCPLCRHSLLLEDVLSSSSSSRRLAGAPPGAQSLVPTESTSAGSYTQAMAEEMERESRASSRGSRGSSFQICDQLDSCRLEIGLDAAALPPQGDHDSSSEEPDHEQALEQVGSMQQQPEPTVCVTEADGSERVMRVELGKVKFDSEDNWESNVIAMEPGTSSVSTTQGLSYSMGSCQYILDSSLSTHVVGEMMTITIPARSPVSHPNFQESHGGGGEALQDNNSQEEVRDHQQSHCMNPGNLRDEDESRIKKQESNITLLLSSRGISSPAAAAAQKISIKIQKDALAATTDKINAANIIRLLSSSSLKLPEDKTGTTDKINVANSIRLSSASLKLPEDKTGTSMRWFRRCLSDQTARFELRLESSSRDYDDDEEMPSSVSTTLQHSSSSRKFFTLNWLMGRTTRLV
jgi:hypothetical protein